MLAGIGSMQALVPPAMIEIDAVGAIAILQLKRSITPMSAASGHGPRSFASIIDAWSTWARMCLKILRFHLVGSAGDIVGQDIVEEAHDVLDELLVLVPLVPRLEVERGEAAYRGSVGTEMVAARGQRDLRAKV